jgi:hypothetical protein
VSASRPGCFIPGEKSPGTHWMRGLVDPRAGLDDVEKRKFLTLPGLKLQPLGYPTRNHSLYRRPYPGCICSRYYIIELNLLIIILLSNSCVNSHDNTKQNYMDRKQLIFNPMFPLCYYSFPFCFIVKSILFISGNFHYLCSIFSGRNMFCDKDRFLFRPRPFFSRLYLILLIFTRSLHYLLAAE